jgi:hypothetical protein
MIRIFVGTPANNEDLESQSVLEYGLRKHASEPIDLTWMKLSTDPKSFWYSNPRRNEGWLTRGWATPFSALRWGIPAACNWEGRAIYMDIDMIPMADIAELWNSKINGNAFCVAKDEKTFCCTLFDNAKARRILPNINSIKREYGMYARLRRNFGPRDVQRFPPEANWNCLDGEKYQTIYDPRIKIVHCTSIPTQPQLRYALKRLALEGKKHWCRDVPRPHWRKDIEDLFDEVLAEAIADGYPPERYKTEQIFGDYMR